MDDEKDREGEKKTLFLREKERERKKERKGERKRDREKSLFMTERKWYGDEYPFLHINAPIISILCIQIR